MWRSCIFGLMSLGEGINQNWPLQEVSPENTNFKIWKWIFEKRISVTGFLQVTSVVLGSSLHGPGPHPAVLVPAGCRGALKVPDVGVALKGLTVKCRLYNHSTVNRNERRVSEGKREGTDTGSFNGSSRSGRTNSLWLPCDAELFGSNETLLRSFSSVCSVIQILQIWDAPCFFLRFVIINYCCQLRVWLYNWGEGLDTGHRKF